jgi:mRNA-degrading endonuclease RelE of RelBE toxin-antitoxin system
VPWEIDRDEAFERGLRDFRKRFPHAESDILDEFKDGHPQRTDPLPGYEEKLWKGRVPSSDAKRGKSGGFRVIYYWDKTIPNWCYLCAFYFKGDCATLPAQELSRIFVRVKARLRLKDEEKAKANSAPESS